MSFSRVSRRATRMWSVYREVGWRPFVQRVARKAGATLGRPPAELRTYLDRKANVDRAFDTQQGVDTGGVQDLYDLSIESANARYGTSHIASDPEQFADTMAAIDINVADATFVDLGSGKARALLMAADYPFQRIVGVEFAAELVAVAHSNLQRRAAASVGETRLSVIQADAAEYEFPNTPLVLYLYNPFDAPIIRKVADRAFASWRTRQRPMRVAYVNPVHHSIWIDAGWCERQAGAHFKIYAPE